MISISRKRFMENLENWIGILFCSQNFSGLSICITPSFFHVLLSNKPLIYEQFKHTQNRFYVLSWHKIKVSKIENHAKNLVSQK